MLDFFVHTIHCMDTALLCLSAMMVVYHILTSCSFAFEMGFQLTLFSDEDHMLLPGSNWSLRKHFMIAEQTHSLNVSIFEENGIVLLRSFLAQAVPWCSFQGGATRLHLTLWILI